MAFSRPSPSGLGYFERLSALQTACNTRIASALRLEIHLELPQTQFCNQRQQNLSKDAAP